MSYDMEWLRDQRVAGGMSFASSMLRTQADTVKYIDYIVEVVAEERGVLLQVERSFHDFQITCQGNIVWFGRDIDVELLRTTSATAFENYLHIRLNRLVELGILKRVKKDGGKDDL